jgi:hypothetical protein
VIAALAAALSTGCDDVPANAVEACQAEVRVLPARTDILVVVDNSGSMREEQENLRQNLAAFVSALAASPIPHDFQIGVTTPDVVDFDGFTASYPFWVAPYDQVAYDIPYPRGALVAVDPRVRNDSSLAGLLVYDPDAGFGGDRILATGSSSLVEDFEANVLVGISGSAKEQPFRAVQLGLTDRLADGVNSGFLRPGARLGLIVVTDEDDCSESVLPLQASTNDLCHDPTVKAEQLLGVADFAAFLGGELGGEGRDPVVAVIAGFDPGTLEPTGCVNSYDVPTRLAALTDTFGPERSFRGSICDESFGPSLQRVADLLVPQAVPLEGEPPDWRMLVASVKRQDGTVVRCPMALSGASDSALAGAVYAPPRTGRAPTVTFQGACRLGPGDEVSLNLICAR